MSVRKQEKTKKRPRISTDTSESEEKEKKQPKRKRIIKKVKDEERSRIAKERIKSQPRQASGKFGSKQKQDPPINGKLAMKPIVLLDKINEPMRKRTTSTKIPIEDNGDKENVDPRQPTPRVEEERSKKPTIPSIVVIPPMNAEPRGIPTEVKTIVEQLPTDTEQERQTIQVPEVAANVDIDTNNGQIGYEDTSNGEMTEKLQQITQQEERTSPKQHELGTPITTAELEQILKEIEAVKEGPDGQKRQAGPSPTEELEQQMVSDRQNSK